MPVIEAMACGVPVITSNTSALPEIAGGAACLVDPQIPEEMYNQLNLLLTDENFYQNKIQAGFINAARFSWKMAASKTLEVYNEMKNTLSIF